MNGAPPVQHNGLVTVEGIGPIVYREYHPPAEQQQLVTSTTQERKGSKLPPLDFILPHEITERQLNIIYNQLIRVAQEKGSDCIRILSPRSPPIDPPLMPTLAVVDDRMDEGPSGIDKRGVADNEQNVLGEAVKKLKTDPYQTCSTHF